MISSTKPTEQRIKARELEVFASRPVHMVGYSSAFLVLADSISKSNTGAVAAVLPLMGAIDTSGLEIRKFFGNHYFVETIITSHDPEHIYFSENTTISEILLICRRWSSGKGPKPATKVVNLIRNPATPAEAISVAWAIVSDTVVGQGYGVVHEWPASRIASGDWGAVHFLSPFLCEQFGELRSGEVFQTTVLGNIAGIGPEGRRIRDAYIKSAMPEPQGRVALWQHDTKVTQSMAAKVDTHIKVKPDKANLAEKYWQQRSSLLLPMRFRLNTVKVVSVRPNTPTLGSSWTPCRISIAGIDVHSSEKALCVFLNSTIGILALAGNRTNREISYTRFSLEDLRNLIVPDFTAIGPESVEKLTAAYHTLSELPLMPLPQMNADPVRQALDDAVCDALGLDGERVATIRRNLAAEPSVTGKRYAGLRPT